MLSQLGLSLNLGYEANVFFLSSRLVRNIDIFMMVFFCVCHVLQNESRILRVKVIAGIDLAKKDIIGAR